MKRLAQIILYIVSTFFVTLVFYKLSLNYVLPPIKYDNIIEFNIAYLNQDEKLVAFFKEKNAKMHDAHAIEIPASQQLNHISLSVPYVYNPSFYFMFGESNVVTFALSNLKVNGTLLENSKIKTELELLGYRVVVNNNVIYAEPQKDVSLGYFDLYRISDNFINIDQNELNDYQSDDSNLRLIYFFIIFLVVLFLLKLIINKFQSRISEESLFTYCVVFYVFLVSFALVSTQIDLSSFSLIEFVIFLKNNLFVIIFPLFILLFAAKFKTFKFLLIPISFLFMLFVGIDHFAQVVFGSRFFWETTAKFAGSIMDGIPFIVSYVSTTAGLLYLLSFILIIPLCIFENRSINKNLLSIMSFLMVISFIILFVLNNSNYSKYYNVVQVNVNGLFTDGDYKRPYYKFKRKTIQDLAYKTYDGLGQHKNVILILVESLACDITFLCGNNYDYSPFIKQLASENIWFPNYYSNNFHTNGAIFTITTGLPLINGAHGEESFFNRTFYENDMVNSFKSEGYITAYYTPASPVLNKQKQLEVSDYTYISTVHDRYYDDKEKKGVFNSASDEDMFNKILYDLQINDNPKFFMLTTISTHTPYITPWGSRNIKQAYEYTDYVLKNFMKKLNDIDYFKNGIVVITGDHRGWGKDSKNSLSIESQRLPLIVIDGESHGVIKDDVSFSHSSIGVMLKYLMLSQYKKNKYQINPLNDSNTNEFILNYDAAKVNSVLIKYGNKEDEILLDGDQTRFLGNSFSADEQSSVLDFLSFLRP